MSVFEVGDWVEFDPEKVTPHTERDAYGKDGPPLNRESTEGRWRVVETSSTSVRLSGIRENGAGSWWIFDRVLRPSPEPAPPVEGPTYDPTPDWQPPRLADYL